jgi:hypothetical protein
LRVFYLGAPGAKFFHGFFIWERRVQISSTLFSLGSIKWKIRPRFFRLGVPSANFLLEFNTPAQRSTIFRGEASRKGVAEPISSSEIPSRHHRSNGLAPPLQPVL